MVTLAELEVGKEFKFEYGPVTREMIKAYGNASGDKNNIHMSEEFATQVGLKGVIAHGMLSFGIAFKHLTDLIGDAKVVTIDSQMRGMVRPGDMFLITIKVKAIEGKKVTFEIIENSKTKIKIENNGEIVKKFEAEERGWITDKDIAKKTVYTEDTDEGVLSYRQRLAIPAEAVVEFP